MCPNILIYFICFNNIFIRTIKPAFSSSFSCSFFCNYACLRSGIINNFFIFYSIFFRQHVSMYILGNVNDAMRFFINHSLTKGCFLVHKVKRININIIDNPCFIVPTISNKDFIKLLNCRFSICSF